MDIYKVQYASLRRWDVFKFEPTGRDYVKIHNDVYIDNLSGFVYESDESLEFQMVIPFGRRGWKI